MPDIGHLVDEAELRNVNRILDMAVALAQTGKERSSLKTMWFAYKFVFNCGKFTIEANPRGDCDTFWRQNTKIVYNRKIVFQVGNEVVLNYREDHKPIFIPNILSYHSGEWQSQLNGLYEWFEICRESREEWP